RRIRQAVLAHVLDDADDRHRAAAAARDPEHLAVAELRRDAPADDVHAVPESAGEPLADDRDARVRTIVGGREEAAGDEIDADRAEVLGADDEIARDPGAIRRRRRYAFHRELDA